MPVEFSEMEQSIIKNMMLRKSYKDISSLLGCNVDDLAFFITVRIEGTDIMTWQMKLDAHKSVKKIKDSNQRMEKKVTAPEGKVIIPRPARDLKREEKKLQEEQLQEFKRKRHLEKLNAENEKKYRRRPPNYKTIAVDYSKMITVRIDRKTVIYANPGEDIEKLKQRFKKNYSKFLLKQNEIEC